MLPEQHLAHTHEASYSHTVISILEGFRVVDTPFLEKQRRRKDGD